MTRLWRHAPLAECLVQRRGDSPIDDSARATFVTVKLHGKGVLRRNIRHGKIPVMRRGLRLTPGDLIYSRIDARNGAFGLVPKELAGAVVSKDFPCFRILADHVEPGYLVRFLTSEVFYSQLCAASSGTTNRQRITEDAFLAYRIPLPPLPEQRRIAAILNEVENLRKLRAAADRRTADLIPALFHEMFGDPAPNRKRWPVARVRDAAAVQGGLQLSSKRQNYLLKRPYLRVANVQRGELRLAEIKEIGLTPDEFKKTRLCAGDVLLVEGNGSPDEIGRAAIWNASIADCVHQNHIIRVRCNASLLVPEFLLAVLNGGTGRGYFLAHGKSTSGLFTISTGVVKDCPILLPPLPLQQHFATAVAGIRAIQEKQIASRRRLDHLFQSLLHRAFTGEL